MAFDKVNYHGILLIRWNTHTHTHKKLFSCNCLSPQNQLPKYKWVFVSLTSKVFCHGARDMRFKYCIHQKSISVKLDEK